MKTITKNNKIKKSVLLALTVKESIYLTESDNGIECQYDFRSGSSSQICYLKNNIVSIFLGDYALQSGLIVYDKVGYSIDDDLGLECRPSDK